MRNIPLLRTKAKQQLPAPRHDFAYALAAKAALLPEACYDRSVQFSWCVCSCQIWQQEEARLPTCAACHELVLPAPPVPALIGYRRPAGDGHPLLEVMTRNARHLLGCVLLPV